MRWCRDVGLTGFETAISAIVQAYTCERGSQAAAFWKTRMRRQGEPGNPGTWDSVVAGKGGV